MKDSNSLGGFRLVILFGSYVLDPAVPATELPAAPAPESETPAAAPQPAEPAAQPAESATEPAADETTTAM